MNIEKLQKILDQLDEILVEIKLTEKQKATIVEIANNLNTNCEYEVNSYDETLQFLKTEWDKLAADLLIYSNNELYKKN